MGDFGTTLHRSRNGWRSAPNPSDVDLTDLWASGPRDVFALGAGRSVHHFNGQQWTAMRLPRGARPQALFGFGANDVLAVGPEILTYDGRQWSKTTLPSGAEWLNAVWGSSPDDVWAVGAFGVIVHYDGSQWVVTHAPDTTLAQQTAAPTPRTPPVDSALLCAPRDVTHDPDYVRGHARALSIEVLYEDHPVGFGTDASPPARTCGPVQVSLGESSFGPLTIERRHTDSFVEIGGVVLLQPDGAHGIQNPAGSLPLYHDTFRKETFTFCDGAVFQPKQPVSLFFDVGEVAVHSVRVYCDDTGVNEVRIKDGTNWIELTTSLNVELFEHDIDNDQSKELYVVSSQGCSGWLRILRIKAKR